MLKFSQAQRNGGGKMKEIWKVEQAVDRKTGTQIQAKAKFQREALWLSFLQNFLLLFFFNYISQEVVEKIHPHSTQQDCEWSFQQW